MIKYLGSKRLLLPRILETVRAFDEVRTVFDVFSGTSRVGIGLRSAGYEVFANDYNAYAATVGRAYLESGLAHQSEFNELLPELNGVEPVEDWFTEAYGREARYFQPFNAAKIEGIRRRIDEVAPAEPLRSLALTSLMEAADRVDSTAGLQMAYLKRWAARSFNPLELRPLDVPTGPVGRATQSDVFDALPKISADLAYIDPPYNQHSYLGNYHVWETLVRYDLPELYGVAQKRTEVREKKSPFNSKSQFLEAFSRMIREVQAPILVVSFNDEGFLSRETAVELLAERGQVLVLEHGYPRYVGAKIGIHNPAGEKVGTISHVRNREYLFVVAPKIPAALRALEGAQSL